MFRKRASWLDHIVYSFQHRWETNPQYRAAISGVVGVALVITMCACTGIVSAATNSALAGIGLGSGAANSSGGSLNTGTNQVKGAKTFPTPTVVLNPGTAPGVSQLPNSQTPQPKPTAIPTATRGGFGAGCNGSQGSAVWALDPCPLVHAQNGTLTIVDKKHPGAITSGTISFCSDPSCTFVLPPDGSYKLDGSGTETINFTVPDVAANSTTPVSGNITLTYTGLFGIKGSQTINISAPPAQ